MNSKVTGEGDADDDNEGVKKIIAIFTSYNHSVTFEHRHENKNSSAFRDRLNERLKVVKVAKVVKLKVFQFLQVFQDIPGSQLLSDLLSPFLLGIDRNP